MAFSGETVRRWRRAPTVCPRDEGERGEHRVHDTSTRTDSAPDVPSGRGAAQAGYALVEVLIAVVLAGMVVLSLAGAMLAVVRVGNQTSDRQAVDAGMDSFSESLRAARYLPCDDAALPGTAANYDAEYQIWSEAWVPRPGMTAEVVSVDHWDGVGSYVSACPGDDRGAQRLTIRVTWRDQERQANVVKRQR